MEFIQAANGAYVATKIEIEDDGNGNVRETSGIVTSVDVVDGTPFVTVGELRFEIVPGETEFEGVSGFDGLVAGESFVEVDYMEKRRAPTRGASFLLHPRLPRYNASISCSRSCLRYRSA